MKTFRLVRSADISGISGIGNVAEGVEFENGQVALHWLSQYDTIGIYSNMHNVLKIHGHDGKTEVVYDTDSDIPTMKSNYDKT